MHRSICEISRETGIHRLTVHRIIHRDLELKCVKRRRAQHLSETNRVARVWLAASSCWRGTVILQSTSYGLRMKKCLPSNHHSTRVYAPVGTKKRRIDPSRHVGYAVRCLSQVVMTELIFVDLGWRWTASITAMSCCVSRCCKQSNVLQNVVYSQNNMLLTAKFVVFVISPR